MAALVQSFPQQSGTITMLQTRPASAGSIMNAQGQQAAQYAASQQRQHFYAGANVMNGPAVYRPSNAPIQPYAFTSTPSLNMNPQRPQQHSYGVRTSSTAPQLGRIQSFDDSNTVGRHTRQTASASMVNLSAPGSSSTPRYNAGSRDDSSLPRQGIRRVSNTPRPHSAFIGGSAPQLTFAQVAAPSRTPPERYRRMAPRSASDVTGVSLNKQKQMSATPSGSGMASVGHLYASNAGGQTDQKRVAISQSQSQQQQKNGQRRNSFHDAMKVGSASDDMLIYRHQPRDDIKRFRRRSMPSLDSADYTHLLAPHISSNRQGEAPASRSPDKDKQRAASRKTLEHVEAVRRSKDGSTDSLSSMSSSSRPSSTNRNASNSAAPTANPASTITASVFDKDAADRNKDSLKLVNIPPRGSSDASNRANHPSTLPKGLTMGASAGDGAKSVAPAGAANAKPSGHVDNVRPATAVPSHLESPAMRHLSAINQKGGRLRSKTSRLRRAFSFGSAAELREAAAASEAKQEGAAPAAGSGKPQRDLTSEELYDAEQDRIAQQQEEAGIGSSIYAGAKIFSGSTDNLSVSSTASSASIMIRKMGRGVKKGTRSLVGLFRPKSIIGTPEDDRHADAQTSKATNSAIEATVSMVTVEAERGRVNVADVNAQNGGGTGFPRLERNSMDTSRVSISSDRQSSSGTDNSARKSIVGGERERAEVLAAVRKGILKNTSGSSSPSHGTTYDLQNPPPINESPASSAPSTPNDDAQGHKRTGSVAIGGEDYFVSALRLQQNSKSGSSTPQGSMRRNATFSPRIVFYDTWPSQEYDRRGEIATCNRLTPMLAQQIKEELNSFKMEMEVHENSKIYTHFF